MTDATTPAPPAAAERTCAHCGGPLSGRQPPKPECEFIAFSLARRLGKVRSVACRLLDKSTGRHATFCRQQVSKALVRQMCRLEGPIPAQGEQLAGFWQAVEVEV